MSRAAIADELTKKRVDRRVKYQLRCRRDGLCIVCAHARSENSALYCHLHMKQAQDRQRKKAGSKPWVAGKPGRPPNSAR